MSISKLRERLLDGGVIPAHPLALDSQRRLDERRQRALTRYYLAAGAHGVAAGVHTTQFAVRDPKIALLRPVLELVSETAREFETKQRPKLLVAGIRGKTRQATAEARLAADLGYDAGLLSLAELPRASTAKLLDHARAVAEVLPLFGFYLQPAAGGRTLSYEFWRAFVEIERVVAIKIAPFDRYRTLDVVRAVRDAGRLGEVALYTGNDDNILLDLVTPYRFVEDGSESEARIVGGLLGHWAVWTRRAIEHWMEARRIAKAGLPVPQQFAALAQRVTDANAALFDARNGFAGCIAGIHEVLRRQGLLEGTWCLDPNERLSPGQAAEIDRVHRDYPSLNDDLFVARHRDAWLR